MGGIGDLVLGYKRVLMSKGTSTIFSLQGEVIVPTGNKTKGLGSGVTTFETFAAFGQTFPRSTFFQMQTGFELPTDTAKVPNASIWRGAVGKTFTQNGRVGRAWTPIVEFLADRDLETGAKTNWDIAPEIQITLNKRQHVRLNIGVRQPVNNTSGRSTQIAFYALVGLLRWRTPRGLVMRIVQPLLILTGILVVSCLSQTSRAAEAQGDSQGSVPDLRPMLRLPQRAGDFFRRGHFHRTILAADNDGQLRAGSLLAGRRPARNPGSSGIEGRNRRRMRHMPHANGPVSIEVRRERRGSLFTSCVRLRRPDGPARSGRCVLFDVPSDCARQTRDARKLCRRVCR